MSASGPQGVRRRRGVYERLDSRFPVPVLSDAEAAAISVTCFRYGSVCLQLGACDQERGLRMTFNADQQREYLRRWRAEHPDIALQRGRDDRRKRPWHCLLMTAKRRANKSNVPYNLTSAWAKSVWNGRCALTDLEFREAGLSVPHSGSSPFSPSIDRIISSEGYVIGNCRFILLGINALRGSGSDDEMFLIAKALIRSRSVVSEHDRDLNAARNLLALGRGMAEVTRGEIGGSGMAQVIPVPVAEPRIVAAMRRRVDRRSVA
jgi:hypothetical protein